MLKLNGNRRYLVYPSWAQLSYAWEALPRLMSDPLKSGYLHEPASYYEMLGYPKKIQPFDLLDGPVGGGIIRAHIKISQEKWLPFALLCADANLIPGPGMRAALGCDKREWDPQVVYLEPMHQIGWELGVGQRRRIYTCGASVEHAEAANGNVYWIVGFKHAKREITGIASLSAWARKYGLEVGRLDAVPEQLQQETSAWFESPGFDYVWIHVNGGGDDVGFHFAVVLYFALHLRRVAGPRMNSMHLVSDVEGKPNARIRWYRQ